MTKSLLTLCNPYILCFATLTLAQSADFHLEQLIFWAVSPFCWYIRSTAYDIWAAAACHP